MKIAVTSASGQLGGCLLKQLLKDHDPQNIVAIARTPAKVQISDVEIRQADYNDKKAFNKALKGIDRVLIISGMDKPENRIQQHRNIIEAAQQNSIKKIVYTSILGNAEHTGFAPIVASNRQTEADIINSKITHVIGRNGLYLEPDLEYLDQYIKDGAVINCAGQGRCAYTSRKELARAYSQLLMNDQWDGQILNMSGPSVRQAELVQILNDHFGMELRYIEIPLKKYREEREKALGPFLGGIIGGIYDSISKGYFDVSGDMDQILGRPHKSIKQMIQEFEAERKFFN